MTRWLCGMVVLGGWLGACRLETEPYPGPIGGTGSTSGSGGATTTTTSSTAVPCVEETAAEDCPPDPSQPCKQNRCVNGTCELEPDDTLVPPGGTECRVLSCSEGEPVEMFTAKDTSCGADPTKTYCDGEGSCVGCEVDDDCLLDKQCPTWECVATPGGSDIAKQCALLPTPAGVPSQTVADCQTLSCEGGNLVATLEVSDVPQQAPADPCMKWACITPGKLDEEADVGKACGTPKTCADAFEKAQDSCDAAGVCQPGSVKECLPFVCDTAAAECKTNCTPATQDQDCAAGYCEANVCQPKIETGLPCGAGGQCFTGFCADGVCCNSACDTACNSCDLGGGTPGVCAPLPKGVIDTCAAGSACNSGVCGTLSTKKAVGQSCIQESDCYNDVGSSLECINGFCRVPFGSACDQGLSWRCSTRFCDSTGVCAECTADTDCGPGGNCDMAGSIDRCDFGPDGVCGNNNECVSNVCNGASASGPGTCQ